MFSGFCWTLGPAVLISVHVLCTPQSGASYPELLLPGGSCSDNLQKALEDTGVPLTVLSADSQFISPYNLVTLLSGGCFSVVYLSEVVL